LQNSIIFSLVNLKFWCIYAEEVTYRYGEKQMAKEDIETIEVSDEEEEEASEHFSDDIRPEPISDKRSGTTRRSLEDLLERKRLMRELEDPVGGEGYDEELLDWR